MGTENHLEKDHLEEKLIKRQKEYEEMKEKIASLTADLFSDVGIMTEGGNGDVSVEHTKMMYENNQIIPRLIMELVGKNQALEVCEEKLKGFARRLAETDKGVEELKQQKLENNKITEEMKGKLKESEVREERLRGKNKEVSQTLEQLTHKLTAAEAHSRKINDRMVEELRRQKVETAAEMGCRGLPERDIMMLAMVAEQEEEAQRLVASATVPPTEGGVSSSQGDTSPRTVHHDSAADVIAYLTGPGARPVIKPPLKRPATSSSVTVTKKSKATPPSPTPISYTRNPIHTPNQNFFIGNSILKNTDGTLATQFIQGNCPSPDRATLEKFSDAELVSSFCLDHSRAEVTLAALISRTRVGFANPTLVNELNSFKKECARLKSKEAKLQEEVCHLRDQANVHMVTIASYETKLKALESDNSALKVVMNDLQIQCTTNIDQARAEGIEIGRRDFPTSPEGYSIIQIVRDRVKQAFLSSTEFIKVLSVGAMEYYNFAFDQAENQLKEKGITEQLDRQSPKRLLPDPKGFVFSNEADRLNKAPVETFVEFLSLPFMLHPASSSGGYYPTPPGDQQALQLIPSSQGQVQEEDPEITLVDDVTISVDYLTMENAPPTV